MNQELRIMKKALGTTSTTLSTSRQKGIAKELYNSFNDFFVFSFIFVIS
jgi:hypothetical protein